MVISVSASLPRQEKACKHRQAIASHRTLRNIELIPGILHVTPKSR
jgi:hypothetical protein